MNNVIDISKQYEYEIFDSIQHRIYRTKSINIRYAYIKFCRILELDRTLYECDTKLLNTDSVQFYKHKYSQDNSIALSIRRVL